MSQQPELFTEPVAPADYRHWLTRISETATIPDEVAAALPDQQPAHLSWLLCAVSLAKIYADAGLALGADNDR